MSKDIFRRLFLLEREIRRRREAIKFPDQLSAAIVEVSSGELIALAIELDTGVAYG